MYGKYETKFIDFRNILFASRKSESKFIKILKAKMKKKYTLTVTHFKRISSRFCVCVVCVCGKREGGGVKEYSIYNNFGYEAVNL